MDSKQNTCYHCGEPCLKGTYRMDNKDFCCQGCRTVYDILKANDLTSFYDLDKNPGNKKDGETATSDFEFLLIPEIKEQVVVFSVGNQETVRWSIPGIHCSSCIWLLERLDQLHSSVIKSEVNFLNKEATITYNTDNFNLVRLALILDSLGYPPSISLNDKGKEKARKKANNHFIYRLGIAGFAFGNIMLLSFPKYLAGMGSVESDFKQFFGYLNIILSLPVFFYCSTPYFISSWKGLKNKFLNIDVPISLGILVLFVRSLYEILSGTGPGYLDSMTGLVFFLLIGRWFQNRTYRALSFEKDYQNYFPLGVNKLEKGERKSVLLKDIREGDHLLIRNNELIPADAILAHGRAFIDYSFVTGESEPVGIAENEKIYAGGRQKGGQIEIVIEKEFSQSYLMQLWKNQDQRSEDPKDLRVMIDRIAQYFTLAVLFMAAGTGIYWWLTDSSRMMHAIASVLIIACPCALALTIPFAYGNGLRLLEKAGLYLRDGAFIEVLANVTAVVFDKTGTITRQKTKDIVFEGPVLTAEQLSAIRSLAALSNHPLSISLSDFLEHAEILEVANYSEKEGEGIRGEINGDLYQLGSAIFLNRTESEKGSSVHVDSNEKYLGKFTFRNVYRLGLKELVPNLSACKVEVISGDNDAERFRLKEIMGSACDLHFNMTPMAKRDHVKRLREQGRQVLMIGDGLNDAGAISVSNVGISISDDIYGFLPACDGILESASFDRIAEILRFTKSVVRVVKISFVLSFAYNLVGMYFAVQGLLSPIVAAILMPLSSVTVAGFAVLGTNSAASASLKNK